MPSHRIFYAGDDITLPRRLQDALNPLDCFVVRSHPVTSHSLIASDINYALLLFDDDQAGADLARYARTVEHRERTPIILMTQSEDFGALVETIRGQLGTIRVPSP